jgi:hypothetical protein
MSLPWSSCGGSSGRAGGSAGGLQAGAHKHPSGSGAHGSGMNTPFSRHRGDTTAQRMSLPAAAVIHCLSYGTKSTANNDTTRPKYASEDTTGHSLPSCRPLPSRTVDRGQRFAFLKGCRVVSRGCRIALPGYRIALPGYRMALPGYRVESHGYRASSPQPPHLPDLPTGPTFPPTRPSHRGAPATQDIESLHDWTYW